MTGNDVPILHQFQVSPFAAKVRRCLYYKGVSFKVVNYGFGGILELRKLNPRGKAPVLEHAGMFIPDSTDIVRYLEDRFPGRPLMPEGSAARALAHIVEDWADESLYFYDLTMRSWPNNAPALAHDLTMEDRGLTRRLFKRLAPRLIGRQAYGQGTGRKDHASVCRELAMHAEALEALLGASDWLAGDQLSIADIAVASMCTVLERAEEANAIMAANPSLVDWRRRVDALTLPDSTPAEQRALV